MIKGIEPRISEGGKIKIGGLGEERTNREGKKWRLPKKFDHFVITGTQRVDPSDDKSDLVVDDAVMQMLRDNGCADADNEIREIPVVVHSDEIDEVFPTCYACYNGKRCICTGDGAAATRTEYKDGKKTGNVQQIECPCGWLMPDSKPQCKPHGTFHCSIALPGAAVAGAVYKWRTTSLMSCQRMLGSLIHIKATTGMIQGLPLTLRLSAVHVEPDGAQASTVYICHLELRAKSLEAVQQRALELAQLRNTVCGKMAETRRQYRALIEAPAVDESEGEQEAISAEFYPDDKPIDAAEEQTDLAKIIAAAKAAPQVAVMMPQAEPGRFDLQAHGEKDNTAGLYEQVFKLASKVSPDALKRACENLGIQLGAVTRDSTRLAEIKDELERLALEQPSAHDDIGGRGPAPAKRGGKKAERNRFSEIQQQLDAPTKSVTIHDETGREPGQEG